jgi:hypothetical protein
MGAGGSWTRSMDLERRLAGLLEGEGITFARALAVDPGTLTVVTLAVPGQALGKVWRFALPGPTRARTVQLLTVAGRAARLIEECTGRESGMSCHRPRSKVSSG